LRFVMYGPALSYYKESPPPTASAQMSSHLASSRMAVGLPNELALAVGEAPAPEGL
jgi:hypothetical protein